MLRKLILLFMILLACFCVLIISLISTTSGTRSLFAWSNQYLSSFMHLDGEIESGSLLRGLKIKDFDLEIYDQIKIMARDLDTKYSLFSPLLKGAFVCDHLKANDLRVVLLEDPEAVANEQADNKAKDSKPYRLSLPTTILVNEVQIDDFAYVSDIVEVYVADFKARLRGEKNHVSIINPSAESSYVKLNNTQTVQPLNPDLNLHEDKLLAQRSNNKENKGELKGLDQAVISYQDSLSKVVNDITEATVEKIIAKHKVSPIKRQVRYHITEKSSLAKRLSLIEALPHIQLPINVSIANLNIAKALYQQDGFDSKVNSLKLTALWQDDLLNVVNLTLAQDLLSLQLKGKMLFKDHYKMDFALKLKGSDSDEALQQFDGALYKQNVEAKIVGDLSSLQGDLSLQGAKEAEIKLWLAPLSENLEMKYQLYVADFSYPRQAKDPKFLLERLEGRGQGSLAEGFKFNLNGVFDGYGFTKSKLSSEGSLDYHNLIFEELSLDGSLEGHKIKLQALPQLDFAKELSYQDNISISMDDAKSVHQNLQGKALVNFNVNAKYIDEQNFKIDVKDLNGDLFLNKHNAKLKLGKLSIDGLNNFAIDKFTFTQDINRITISGQSLSSIGLKANLSLRRLNFLHPSLAGDFTSTLLIKGKFSDYLLKAKGNSNYFRMGDFIANGFVFDGNYNRGRNSVSLNSYTQSINFIKGMQASQRCLITAKGTTDSHFMQMGCAGANSGYIEFKGGYDDKIERYEGRIKELFITNELSGDLTLQQPIDIVYQNDSEHGYITAFKLMGDLGNLEVDKSLINHGIFTTALKLENFNSRNIELFIDSKSNIKSRGKISLHMNLSASKSRQIVDLNLSSKDLMLLASDMPLRFRDFKLNMELNNEFAQLGLKTKLGPRGGNIDSLIRLDRPYTEKLLSGHLNINQLDMSIFANAASLGITHIDGKANMHTKLSGTAAKPLINGTASIKGMLEPRYSVGTVERYDLNLVAKGKSADIKGTINFNGNDVHLDGKLDFAKGADGVLGIKSDKLPVLLMGYGGAITSVDSKIYMQEGKLDIKGKVKVDSAKVKFSSIADSAVMPSKDEIVIASDGLKETDFKRKSNLKAKIDLDFDVGQSFSLDIMGLLANLEGKLKIQKDYDNEIINGFGQMHLVNGRATVYGHDFIVNHAISRFKGNITEPSLDVEVIADPSTLEDDVTVGLHVKGKATEPSIEFFSVPTMSQNEIMSYILYGYSLEKSSGNKDGNNNMMLMNLGLTSTTSIVNTFVGSLGINNISFNTVGSGDDTKVGVETYLSNKVKLSYGYGIFNAVSEFSLRYEILRNLYAQFTSAIDQSIDIIYRFEID